MAAGCYLNVVHNSLPVLLQDIPLESMWFQHQTASTYVDRQVTGYPNCYYPNWRIGRCGPQAWPARSTDYVPWRHGKENNYFSKSWSPLTAMGKWWRYQKGNELFWEVKRCAYIAVEVTLNSNQSNITGHILLWYSLTNSFLLYIQYNES